MLQSVLCVANTTYVPPERGVAIDILNDGSRQDWSGEQRFVLNLFMTIFQDGCVARKVVLNGLDTT